MGRGQEILLYLLEKKYDGLMQLLAKNRQQLHDIPEHSPENILRKLVLQGLPEFHPEDSLDIKISCKQIF
jgi:bacterioferritin (cytochrome b1)